MVTPPARMIASVVPVGTTCWLLFDSSVQSLLSVQSPVVPVQLSMVPDIVVPPRQYVRHPGDRVVADLPATVQ